VKYVIIFFFKKIMNILAFKFQYNVSKSGQTWWVDAKPSYPDQLDLLLVLGPVQPQSRQFPLKKKILCLVIGIKISNLGYIQS
jgi:hypothetical protein